MKKFISALMCVVLVLQLSSCTQADENTKATETITAMNTVMQITVFNTSKGTPQEVLELMKARINELDGLFNANSENSDVSRINNFSGSEFENISVSEDTVKILESSLAAYYSTDYLFDIKLMPIISLWGFDNGKYGVPKTADIEKALEMVENSRILIYETDNAVRKTEGTQISLGGIAKGYLGDRLLEIAEEYGATALVSLGGNIVLCGEKGESEKWSVGIKDPLDTENIALSFECGGNRSVVTSGGYERCFEYGGKEYHHIIDPKTGYPADSDLLSVTVVGENGAMCDACSTALFVMGREKAVEFAKESNDYDFILITENNEVYITDGIAEAQLEGEYTLRSIER